MRNVTLVKKTTIMPPTANSTTEEILNLQDVIVIAQKVKSDPTVEVLEYHVGPYSTNKLGFLATHKVLNIKLQRKFSNSPENVKLFVKTLLNEDEESSQSFGKEANFFDAVMPALLEDYVGEKWSPVCYLARKNVMVMEDLRSQNYKLLGKFFDDPAATRSTLMSLARYHACSIVAEARLSRDSKVPKTLPDYFPECCEEGMFIHLEKGNLWFSQSVNTATRLAERLGVRMDKFNETFNRMAEAVKTSKIHRNVLCHGDMWANNFMFDTSESAYKCVLVDFQLVRYAPLVLDILHMLYLTTTRDFRKKYERDYVKMYHDELEETVKRCDKTRSAEIPTIDQIFIALDDLRFFGAGFACLEFPMILLDSATLNECTKTPEDHEKFLFGDRTKFTLSYMEKDQFYKSRIEEAITEFAQISVKL